MKKLKFLSFLFSAVLAASCCGGLSISSGQTVNAEVSSEGEEASPEIFEMFKEYFEERYLSELYFVENGENVSTYSYLSGILDDCTMMLDTDSIDKISEESLRDIVGLSEEELYIKITLTQYSWRTDGRVTLRFYGMDHEANYRNALKIAKYVSDIYSMQPAEMTIGVASGQKDMCIAWDDMTRTD